MTKTNDELQQIKEDCDTRIKKFKEKIKTFEKNFEESEVIKKKTISDLKDLYENETTQQRTKYETMIEDQIRKSFRQLKEKEAEVCT
uniref:Uncharacterized protein n=1 Tax=Caenorhabditis japonica TaxID=281687 RepID=A0A8R1EFE7_CAEJA